MASYCRRRGKWPVSQEAAPNLSRAIIQANAHESHVNLRITKQCFTAHTFAMQAAGDVSRFAFFVGFGPAPLTMAGALMGHFNSFHSLSPQWGAPHIYRRLHHQGQGSAANVLRHQDMLIEPCHLLTISWCH